MLTGCNVTLGLSEAKKVYKIYNLTDEEATLIEPAACAIHGMDKLNPPVGIDALVIGAGPTGLILAQLLKMNGASRVIIAANKGIKTQIAKELGAADEYIELDRNDPAARWEKIQADNPYGFDVVVEATGNEKVANDSINYVRRGGTLMVYGVYSNDARVHWSPSKIFSDEIRVRQLFQVVCSFTRTPLDHWVVCANVLFPSCRCLPGQRKNQRQGYGEWSPVIHCTCGIVS